MLIDIKEDNPACAVLALVLALVEVIRDALKLQALKRMDASLTTEESERLGEALMALDRAVERIKEEQGLVESVKSVRESLDGIVDNLIDELIHPEEVCRESKPGTVLFGS